MTIVGTETQATAFRARGSRRAQIEQFFLEHVGEHLSSVVLHERFGPAFRTRVSEINRHPASAIRILNKTTIAKDAHGQPCERSTYWSEFRGGSPAQEPTESDFMRRRSEEEAAAMPLFARVRT